MLDPVQFRAYQHARRQRLKAARRCACGHGIKGAAKCCARCRRRMRGYRRRLRRTRAKLGLCYDCGLPSEGSRRVCRICRFKRRLYLGGEAKQYGAGPRGARERAAIRLGLGIDPAEQP